ncbi:MAG: RNA 2',3'-cyclic phosphodiesterase [Euryarchaeota archaeon HGW-Euryarchaeota-1]|nr:MAG: RNA 2',3'-cyclic phosphodiesterase [Euryarchaeota archaeon HGW-Euryarchaeota-1]
MNNYFIAIKLPSEIVANVFPVGAQINEFSKATIVSYENLHLTLKFLGGALTFKQVEEVKQALRFVKLKPFSIQMRGTMAFPSTKFARVIGIGVEKSVHFLDLRKQVDDVLPPLTQADNREFIPHLTLACSGTLR